MRLIDGGHFDNLGLYELVRRRCRYIVAVDSGEDACAASSNLAIAIRLCRNDFGVRIDIETGALEPMGQPARSQWHCAVGSIRYDDVDEDEIPGILVYLKISLTGDEPTDIQHYAATHPGFPHQSTLDQFFDEAQFESYRALGYHIADRVFDDASKGCRTIEIDPPGPNDAYAACVQKADYAFSHENKDLFSRIRRRWFPPPPEMESRHQDSIRRCLELEDRLGADVALRALSDDLYPEVELSRPAGPSPEPGATDSAAGGPNPPPIPRRPADLYAVLRMVQIMEDVWLGQRLEAYREHPFNIGWMNVFRRWTSAATFRRCWPAVRGEFTREFVRFCEQEFRLTAASWATRLPALKKVARKGEVLRVPVDRSLRDLDAEFALEWPSQTDGRHGPIAVVDGLPMAWIIWSATRSTPEDRPDRFACGFIRVDHDRDDPTIFELIVWMRGAYRCQGIGRYVLARSWRIGEEGVPADRTFVDEICEELKAAGLRDPAVRDRDLTLRVRYPRPHAEEDVELARRDIWLNFFGFYEFRKLKKVRACVSDDASRRRKAAREAALREATPEARAGDPRRSGKKPRERAHETKPDDSDVILVRRIERTSPPLAPASGTQQPQPDQRQGQPAE